MRLGQLARKLAIRTTDIVSFLESQHIQIDPDTNARVDDQYLPLIMTRFDPNYQEENSADPDTIENTRPATEEPSPTFFPEETGLMAPLENDRGQQSEQPSSGDDPLPVELIKAPKVSLPGLTVLGKIELQQARKETPKDVVQSDDNQPNSVADSGTGQEPSPPNKGHREKRRVKKNARGRDKNPVAVQREKLAREAERQRKEQLTRDKERRMNHYMKKVKPSVPTKPARIHQEETEELVVTHVERPRSLWGRFFRWLRRGE